MKGKNTVKIAGVAMASLMLAGGYAESYAQDGDRPVRRPLIEEYTGLWCGSCPRGLVALELIDEQYGEDAVSISYHVDDQLMVTNVFPMNISQGGITAVPTGSVNRVELLDPYYGKIEPVHFGIKEEIDKAIAQGSIAWIDVEATLTGTNIQATTTVKFVDDLADNPYLVGYVLTSNGLTKSGWVQNNDYAGMKSIQGEPIEGTPLEELAQWGPYQRGLTFNFTAIDVNGMKGVAGSLPAEIKAGEEYTHEFSYNISGNPLVQDPANLVVNVFLVDKVTGRVENANKYAFSAQEESGVDSVVTDSEVTAVAYYDLAGRRLVSPDHGIVIRVETLSDGSSRTSKIVL